jgi:hypothetical protein
LVEKPDIPSFYNPYFHLENFFPFLPNFPTVVADIPKNFALLPRSIPRLHQEHSVLLVSLAHSTLYESLVVWGFFFSGDIWATSAGGRSVVWAKWALVEKDVVRCTLTVYAYEIRGEEDEYRKWKMRDNLAR